MDGNDYFAMWSRSARREPVLPDEERALDDGELRVHEWRTQQLQGLGLSRLLANMFAPLVDWHEVAKLVERGCSPELALEIAR